MRQFRRKARTKGWITPEEILKEGKMKTPDGPIVPLGEEDRSFPDEVKEIFSPDEIAFLENEVERIKEKSEKFARRKLIKEVKK